MQIFERYIEGACGLYEDIYANFKINATENFNFGFDVVDALADEQPDKLAILWVNDKGDERRITFSDLKKLSNQAANLLKELGINKGDMVMLILKRHYQYWVYAVALHKIGAVLIPATNQLMEKDIAYRIDAAGVKMIICTADGETKQYIENIEASAPDLKLKALANADRPGWINFDKRMAQMPDVFERPVGVDATKATDPFLIYFTSGTTGYPKMAMHNYMYPLGHIQTAKFWHRVRPEGLHFTIADTGWAKASWGKIYGQWLAEGAVFVYDFEKFHAKDILSMIEKYRITTFCAPPTMYRMITQEPMDHYNLKSLIHCTSAGEPLNPEVIRDFQKYTGIRICEGFGQSETTVCIATLYGIEPRIGSMGKLVPGYDIVLLSEDGGESPVGEVGEICIRTSEGAPKGLFTCYYKDKEKTDNAWYDGFYHTGDTAWKDEDDYYWYVGRGDDIIKSSGYRIGPFEVESALLEHESVLEAAITGVPDPVRGQIIKATIVLKTGYVGNDALTKELQEHVKHVTAPYKYPRVIEYVDVLPKTVSGKIRRIELRQS
jgi:acetyl-CoA synthetase